VNVTCDKCGKKYVVADDKLAGKASVKIRCKQCQHLISLTLSGAAAPAPAPAQHSPWEDEATRALPPPDPTAQWFAMVGGKQEGPFDLAALKARVDDGMVTLRTYLWKAGMGDWKRAADLPEVSTIFAGVAPPPPPRPPSKQAPAVQRDVALANELPAPGVSRPSAQSGAGAVVAARAAPLNELFSDLSNPRLPRVDDAAPPREAAPKTPEHGERDGTEEHPQESGPAPQGAAFDPFAALSKDDGVSAPPIGEATRFFIAQAGVNKRNPPWKIALFVLAFIGGPLALLYVLNTFQIVKLPTVTRTTDDGQEVQESFFSTGGATGLKELLTGEAKAKREAAEQARREREARAKALAATRRPTEPAPEEPPKPKPQDPTLAAFYGEGEAGTKGPRIRKTDAEAAATVNQGGLTQEAAMKVVADKSKAFQLCIDNALRRNPNLAVGSIVVVLNVGSSGAVRSASVEPKKHETADWAQCMKDTGRRIVFPASDGETTLELPFKVGVAVAP
jgi:predicted Zn finger-like uncharacterized protein